MLTHFLSWPVAMLARSNLIYAVIWLMPQLNAICAGTWRGSGGSLPQFWGRVDGAPKPSGRTEVAKFSFCFICEKTKGWKISDLKPMRKLDLGYLGFFLLWTTLANVSWAPSPPQPEDSSRATEYEVRIEISSYTKQIIFRQLSASCQHVYT